MRVLQTPTDDRRLNVAGRASNDNKKTTSGCRQLTVTTVDDECHLGLAPNNQRQLTTPSALGSGLEVLSRGSNLGDTFLPRLNQKTTVTGVWHSLHASERFHRICENLTG